MLVAANAFRMADIAALAKYEVQWASYYATRYGGRLPLVSITRLRVRSWRFLPAFFVAALRSAFQARRARDNLAVTILREAHNTFWTRSIWASEAAMKSFMVSGVHRKVMPKLLNWCDEASVARWTSDLSQEPTWEEVHLRMQRDGRVSRVNHPSEAQLLFRIPALEMKRSKELRFR
jgi:hypothetical protein